METIFVNEECSESGVHWNQYEIAEGDLENKRTGNIYYHDTNDRRGNRLLKGKNPPQEVTYNGELY